MINGWFRLIYMDSTTSISEEHHAHACEVNIMFSVIFSETIRWLFVLTPRFEQYPSQCLFLIFISFVDIIIQKVH